MHQAHGLAGVPGGAWRGVPSTPHELSTLQEQHCLAAFSLSQLDVTNSLPMTSPARYSVPASSEPAEDRAGGDCFGEKGFFPAKARKTLSQLPLPQSKLASELPTAVLGCGSDTLGHCGGAAVLGAPYLLLSGMRAVGKALTEPPRTLSSEMSPPSSKHLKPVY